MLKNSKFFFIKGIFILATVIFTEGSQLLAYVVIPRSTADTTDRMNGGGDPEDRPGLRDLQRSPEYLDDYWGKRDYNYYDYQRRDMRGLGNPAYDLNRPPYYPYPNSYYYDTPSSSYLYPYSYGSRYYYQPTYPVAYPPDNRRRPSYLR